MRLGAGIAHLRDGQSVVDLPKLIGINILGPDRGIGLDTGAWAGQISFLDLDPHARGSVRVWNGSFESGVYCLCFQKGILARP